VDVNIGAAIEKIKQHPDYHRAGMMLCHNGVVRATSRDGREVSGLKVSVDHQKLNHILENYKKVPGIIEISCEIAEDRHLNVGDDVMLLVVAGDYRENVIRVLHAALDDIKKSVTAKTEYFI
jgi:molybdopterin synthase catalytic subunit